MNNTLRKITNECFNCKNNKYYRKIGNFEVYRNFNYTIHKYYGDTICIVDNNSKQFSLYAQSKKRFRQIILQLQYLEKFYEDKKYTVRKLILL